MWWIVGGAVVIGLVAVWVARTYNVLVALRNKCEEAWSGIDVELQRRADLVPNLVEVVKGYASHEKSTFEDVVTARQAVKAARGPVEAEAADNMLTAALRQMFLLAEAYPELKASAGFLELQRQLAKLEEDIAFSRRYHNAVVEDFNTRVESVPTMLVAKPFGFDRRPFFQADGGSRSVPEVQFDGGGAATPTPQPPPPDGPATRAGGAGRVPGGPGSPTSGPGWPATESDSHDGTPSSDTGGQDAL